MKTPDLIAMDTAPSGAVFDPPRTRRGKPKGQVDRPWSEFEKAKLSKHYPKLGAKGCASLFRFRTENAIAAKAFDMGLSGPKPQALKRAIADSEGKRLLQLRADGWSCERIAAEYGVSEQTALNALLLAECVAAGFTPAKRDSTGALLPREVKRMRGLLLQGMKQIDVARQMGISVGNVSHHYRKYRAELEAEGKADKLPLPGTGTGQRYSATKLTRPEVIRINALLRKGWGAPRIAKETGVSESTAKRLRARLVKRLKAEGVTLPGCDANGRRVHIVDCSYEVPTVLADELVRLLHQRWPVKRAAAFVGIGDSSGYHIRDERIAAGETFPPPRRPGKSRAQLVDRWLPPELRLEYFGLCREVGFADAKRQILARANPEPETRPAERRPLSFEEQLARAKAGAKLEQRVDFHRQAYAGRTLGGVTGEIVI